MPTVVHATQQQEGREIAVYVEKHILQLQPLSSIAPIVTRAMSRKKTLKGKRSSKSPKGSPSSGGGRTGKGLAAGASPTSGLVYPSRPSISSSGEFYDIAFKVMLVGDSGVGKTCLLVRFKDGAFLAGSFISTVGIDFRNKVMSIDAVKVKLQIWDTAGQERFRSVTHAYYRDAHALLLLYDVTNKASFDNIRADSTHDRVVKREEGEKLAKEFGVPFMETSARSGLNVELAFTAVAKELKHRTTKEPDEPKFQLQEYVNKEMRTAGCCRS
ncbi:ras-related protein Rab-26 isoform X2 [Phyllopteryx taeniolatus]|uniref:ras-related protein Rab-26 isoform X2 n=1 Tax=Phyllopteryx taeniolatus TaxID=161469 RepID=UPI002AD3E60A|nr:ras-related protein Rab-26 isoform X2 [Phyllopteryx taeniolatus]